MHSFQQLAQRSWTKRMFNIFYTKLSPACILYSPLSIYYLASCSYKTLKTTQTKKVDNIIYKMYCRPKHLEAPEGRAPKPAKQKRMDISCSSSIFPVRANEQPAPCHVSCASGPRSRLLCVGADTRQRPSQVENLFGNGPGAAWMNLWLK